MTKGEIEAVLIREQLKFDKLLVDLTTQGKDLQCMAVIKQTLKIEQLQELLHQISIRGIQY